VRNVVLVTGGTGKTGGRVARRLAEAGHPVRIGSRSAEVPFDWLDPSTYDAALSGVDRVYLVAPPVEDPYPVMTSFARRAMDRGVRRFVLLSASSLPEGGPMMGAVHRSLRETAAEWAVLRPTWFMQNFSEGPHATTIREEGRIYSATGAGRVPFVDAVDIAEVAYRALTDELSHNTDHLITGPRALTYAEAADAIGEAMGRPVAHVNLTESELAEHWVRHGLPPEYAGLLAAMDIAIAKGSEDRTTDTVLRVTGRPPKDFREFARESAEAWKAGDVVR
jgi:ergot alkaloid biosynthesis protein